MSEHAGAALQGVEHDGIPGHDKARKQVAVRHVRYRWDLRWRRTGRGSLCGMVRLLDPVQKATDFYYSGIGGGYGLGGKVKLGRIKIAASKVSLNIAPPWFDSLGIVLVTSSCLERRTG